MKKMIAIIAVLFIFGLTSSIYFAKAEGQYVAKVGDALITQADLDEALNKQYASATLDALIQDKIVVLEAEKQGVVASEEEINKQLNTIMEQQGGEDAFNTALASSNMTIEDFKQNLNSFVLASKLIEKQVDTSDEALQEYLSANAATFNTEAQVEASHILVADEATALKVKAELDGGADFAAQAEKYSTDTGSVANGGSVGFFSAGDMVPEFSEAAFAMKKGEVSEPVKSDYGYHIIKVTDTKEATDASLENLKDEVKAAYVQAQVNEQYGPWLMALMEEYKVDNTLTSPAE